MVRACGTFYERYNHRSIASAGGRDRGTCFIGMKESSNFPFMAPATKFLTLDKGGPPHALPGGGSGKSLAWGLATSTLLERTDKGTDEAIQTRPGAKRPTLFYYPETQARIARQRRTLLRDARTRTETPEQAQEFQSTDRRRS